VRPVGIIGGAAGFPIFKIAILQVGAVVGGSRIVEPYAVPAPLGMVKLVKPVVSFTVNRINPANEPLARMHPEHSVCNVLELHQHTGIDGKPHSVHHRHVAVTFTVSTDMWCSMKYFRSR